MADKYVVFLQRRWFGEELKEQLAEYDHKPSSTELRQLGASKQLGGGATLYMSGANGKAPFTSVRARDLPPD